MKNIRNNILFFVVIICIWQIVYQIEIYPKLMLPSPLETFRSLINSFQKDSFLLVIGYSLGLIFKGLMLGVIFALIFSTLSIFVKCFYSIYKMIITICDPLPGIALLPLAILWFGIGENTIIFIIVHSVVWPMSRSIIDGFSAIPKIYIEVGKNIGLTRFSIIPGVYFPASFPYIISGLKVGWARAWRALIAAEMIFGVSGSIGGLGWYIFVKRYQLDTAGVFASLIAIIVIGLIVEYGFFSQIEKRTVKRWGMMQ